MRSLYRQQSIDPVIHRLLVLAAINFFVATSSVFPEVAENFTFFSRNDDDVEDEDERTIRFKRKQRSIVSMAS